MWNKMWNNDVESLCIKNEPHASECGIMRNNILVAWDKLGYNLGAFGFQTGHQQI